MKKLFISQPMRGKTVAMIKAERTRAIQRAKELVGEPVKVIESFFENATVNANPLCYLGKSLELLSYADIAYFASGWKDARGCKIEHTCALEYGIVCIEE